MKNKYKDSLSNMMSHQPMSSTQTHDVTPLEVKKIKGKVYVSKEQFDERMVAFGNRIGEDAKRLDQFMTRAMKAENEVKAKEKEKLEMEVELKKEILKLKQEKDNLEKRLYIKDNPGDEDEGNTRINF